MEEMKDVNSVGLVGDFNTEGKSSEETLEIADEEIKEVAGGYDPFALGKRERPRTY